ncbi:uncharacterized protein [Nicotiana sylvestris]|uniref:uncharacterized protein n=1 Tax=Nicotiana sylvestris TaxID=4096 RepID=UPI00388CA41A
MKKDIAEFVAQCPKCQQVKIEHKKLGGLLQAIEIPTWKWEVINMEFIVGLPRTQHKFNSIWVIVDRLTKSVHFLPVRTTYSSKDYARLYIKEIVRVHGVPVSIILDRGAQFTASFGGPSKKDWGLNSSRQKSYADNRWRDLEFQVDDWVFLKVLPIKGAMRFGKRGKHSPRYIGPYRIIRKVGQVAYELDLPSDLEIVHPVFHVSMLYKCIGDPPRIMSVDDVQVTEQLSYEETPIAILDIQVRRLRTKDIASVKILWRNNNVEEMTWEAEEVMKSRCPYLFPPPEKGPTGTL